MTQTTGPDRWSQATAYEAFMGRWSRAAARAFVQALPAPPHGYWLDFGCGTGALAQAILDLAAPASVVACDPSADFVAFASARQQDPRVRFEVADVSSLSERAGDFDVVASSLVLNFLPDPLGAMRQLLGRIRAGGLFAGSVWDYADGMQYLRIFWDAARALDPQAASLDEGTRFPLCAAAPLRALFAAAGLADITTASVVIETRFANFCDYWDPFLGGVGPAGTYVASLGTPARNALASAMQERLPCDAHGRIALTARCWVVWGRVPSHGDA